MRFTRRFTKEGQSPYEGMTFERREAKVSMRDGSDSPAIPVTVPAQWSQTAAEMLATKYLRRAGVPSVTNHVVEDGLPKWLCPSIPEPGCSFGSEDDCRQVFGRIAGCYCYHGWKAGYFDSEADALAFHDEVVWMLANQYAAPNSPTWFNGGVHWAYGITGADQGYWHFDADGTVSRSKDTYTNPAASACFIQSLEDTLLGENGIVSFVEREARVFKLGSGSGANASKLRGKDEPLSGGGKSSGLMSWLPMFDTNAGSIKSGGTVRRAARMVILDLDHPDIEDFVNWKNLEEFKVAAMVSGARVVQRHVTAVLKAFHSGDDHKLARARKAAKRDGVPGNVIADTLHLARTGAGEIELPKFDTDFEGEAYRTVGGQNANNSVSVPNAFMEAVEAGGEWALKSRTGKVADRKISARKLWQKIIHSAWACADPGLYFKDTINDWATCRSDGEITGANPCLVGDTLVETDAGRIRIDELASSAWEGRLPKAMGWSDGGPAVNQIVRAWKTGEATEVWTVVTSLGLKIRCTGNHRFLLADGAYAEAKDLKYGDLLRSGMSTVGSDAVEFLYVDTLTKPTPVYDLEVTGTNNFSVSDYEDPRQTNVVVHNCGEYLHNTDTACTLGCLNLARFFDPESGKFDDEAFRHASRIWTVALDISVGMGQYPSRGIADGSYKHRTIGLGHCNVGSLLMASGLPYDSDDGRAMAAAVTAIMHFEAYRTSAEIAASLGTFPRYEANKEHVERVLTNHAVCAGSIEKVKLSGVSIVPPMPVRDRGNNGEADEISRLCIIARQAAVAMTATTRRYGVRNAQISVCMPAGTVGLLMDASTTGIEPDFSLVKHKKLAGGGYLKIVNQTIPAALERLGYKQKDIDLIVKAVEETGTVETCDRLKVKHLAVFDCANRCGPKSVRSIRPLAHVEMVAACQPFLSGGISKTINLPNDATEADVESVFLAAWKSGVKAIPVYRDGSKLSQPLNSSVDAADDNENDEEEATEKVVVRHKLKRKDLPARRKGYTQKARIADHKLYLQTGEYPDGTLGEIFLTMHKEGAAFRAMADALAMAVSIALQHGTPLEEFVEAFTFTNFEPKGAVQGNARVKNCSSVLDYVFRELGVSYLGRDDLAHAPADTSPTTWEAPPGDPKSVVNAVAPRDMGYEGDACRTCGNFTLVRTGTCLTCRSCGTNSGCS